MNVDKEKDEKEIIMLKGALKEKASCISDLMYLVEDFKVLQKALDPLKNVFKAMDAACVKQEGLPIQQSPRKQSWNLKTWNTTKFFILSYLFADDPNGQQDLS